MTITASRLPRGALLGMALLAAGVRVAHFLCFADHPLVTHPQLDALFYHIWALDVLRGADLGTRTLWAAPAYPSLLAAVYWLFGPGIHAVQILQHLAGVASCVVLSLALARLLPARAALAAGFLWACYPLNPYYESFLLPTCWIVYLGILALHMLLWARERPGARRMLAAGLVWGILCITSENYLYLALPLFFFYFRALLEAAAFLAGLAALILPIAARNHALTGELIPVSAHGGEAVYLANNPRTDGLYNPMYHGFQKITGHELQRQRASQMAGRPLGYGEANRFWFQKTAGFVLGHPLQYLGLLGTKALLAVHTIELPNNEDYRYLRRRSPVLLYNPLSFGLLFPFAVLGLAAAWSQRRRLALLYFFFAVNLVPVLVVFAASRYRMPLLPFVTAFAVLGAAGLRAPGRRGKLLLLGGLFVLCNRPWPRLEAHQDWSPRQVGAIALAEGRFDEAVSSFDEALSLDPGNPGITLLLGQAYASGGRYLDAYRAFQSIERVHPDKARVRLEMARTLRALGRCEVAVPMLQRLLEADPANSRARQELALCQPR